MTAVGHFDGNPIHNDEYRMQTAKIYQVEDYDMLPDHFDSSKSLEKPHTRSFSWRYFLDVIRYLCVSLAHGSALLWSRTSFHTDNEHHPA